MTKPVPPGTVMISVSAVLHPLLSTIGCLSFVESSQVKSSHQVNSSSGATPPLGDHPDRFQTEMALGAMVTGYDPFQLDSVLNCLYYQSVQLKVKSSHRLGDSPVRASDCDIPLRVPGS